MVKQKLGRLQEFWVSRLEKYPERQITNKLGTKEGDSYKACCLGEAVLCTRLINKKSTADLFDKDYNINSNGMTAELSEEITKKYGFYSSVGEFKKEYSYHKKSGSLAELNDNGFTWPQIAAIIRKNPGNVFKESK